MKRILTLAIVALLVAALAACQQPSAPTADLAPILDRLDAQGANLDAVRDELISLREKVEELRRSAVLLDASVRNLGSIDVTSINWGALTGVVIHTSPATLEVNAEPGDCPDDTDDGLALPPRNSVIGTSFHPLPAGTYCLSSPADDTHQAVGRTVVIPDGVVAETLLIPQFQPAEGD